jgi:hypothetical protein
MPAVLVKENWRKKTFTVTGTMHFRTAFIGEDYLSGSGCQVGNKLEITFPWPLNVNFIIEQGAGTLWEADHYSGCNNPECSGCHGETTHTVHDPLGPPCFCCPPDPNYQANVHPVHLHVGWGAIAGEWTGQCDVDFDWDYNLDQRPYGPHCVPEAATQYCEVNDYDVSYSVTVECWTDLFMEVVPYYDQFGSRCEALPGGVFEETYCEHQGDRNGSYLPDIRMRFGEQIHDKGGGVGDVTVHAQITVGGVTHTYEETVERLSVDWTDNTIEFWGEISCSAYGCASRPVEDYIVATWLRTFTQAPTGNDPGIFHYDHQHAVYDATLRVYLDNNRFAFGCRWAHRSLPGIPDPTGWFLTEYWNHAGKITTPYHGTIAESDGTPVTGVQMKLRHGTRPIYEIVHYPGGDEGLWTWGLPAGEVAFVDGADVPWNGWWKLISDAVGSIADPGGPYIIFDTVAEYFDVPEQPPQDNYINQGLVNITNADALFDPFYPQFHDPPESIEFDLNDDAIPDYTDSRVLLKPSLASDVLHWQAVRVDIGVDYGEESAPILTFDGDGWTKNREDLQVTTDNGVKVTGAQIGDWIEQSFLTTKKRLTGARFAHLHWHSDAAGEIKFSVNGRWWVLTADAAGEHESVIDLCRPNYTESADQVQSIIPVELPKNLNLPPLSPGGTHGTDLGTGFGVGRIDEVKFEFNVAGTYIIRTITLYRKTQAEGGFIRIDLNPQSAFYNAGLGNPNRIPAPIDGIPGGEQGGGDCGVYYAGQQDDGTHTWECYLYRAGIVIVDGAVVGEIVIGGPQLTSGFTYDGWTFAMERMASGIFWCIPFDDYCTPTESPAANGVVSLVRLDPPKIGGNLAVPETYVGYLDRVAGELADQQTLSATVRFDVACYAVGFGNVIGSLEKYTKGDIHGIAYKDSDPGFAPGAKVTIVADGVSQNVQTNSLGYFRSHPVRARALDASATVTGKAGTTVTVYPRNRHYGRAIPVGEAGGAARLDLAIAPFGRIYRVYTVASDVYVGHSDNGGKSWTEHQVTTSGDADSPSIECDATGQVWLVYGRSGQVLMRHSNSEGDIWSAEVNVGAGTHPEIYFDPRSEIITVYWVDADAGKIYARRRTAFAWMDDSAFILSTGQADLAASDDVLSATPVLNASGHVGLLYRKPDGTLDFRVSAANGANPYVEP